MIFFLFLPSMEYDHVPNLVGDMSLLIPQVFGVNVRVIFMNLLRRELCVSLVPGRCREAGQECMNNLIKYTYFL